MELQERLRSEKDKQLFGKCSLDIADLQEVDILEKRMRLGKGELFAIAFAKKAGLGFMTDDQKARRLGSAVIDSNNVQTTPQLFGWLFFNKHLGDVDKDEVIREHEHYSRPLGPFFEEMYNEALRCRLMAR
jgi:predicted nucleic acid-binding protein